MSSTGLDCVHTLRRPSGPQPGVPWTSQQHQMRSPSHAGVPPKTSDPVFRRPHTACSGSLLVELWLVRAPWSENLTWALPPGCGLPWTVAPWTPLPWDELGLGAADPTLPEDPPTSSYGPRAPHQLPGLVSGWVTDLEPPRRRLAGPCAPSWSQGTGRGSPRAVGLCPASA